MTYIEQAIRDAVEKGGWKPKDVEMHKVTSLTFHDGLLKLYGTYNKTQRDLEHILQEQIFLDPAFWQALGKARGWPDNYLSSAPQEMGWFYNWHRLITHLADGKDAESYFASLV
jgi:hypothetical protein